MFVAGIWEGSCLSFVAAPGVALSSQLWPSLVLPRFGLLFGRGGARNRVYGACTQRVLARRLFVRTLGGMRQ